MRSRTASRLANSAVDNGDHEQARCWAMEMLRLGPWQAILSILSRIEPRRLCPSRMSTSAWSKARRGDQRSGLAQVDRSDAPHRSTATSCRKPGVRRPPRNRPRWVVAAGRTSAPCRGTAAEPACIRSCATPRNPQLAPCANSSGAVHASVTNRTIPERPPRYPRRGPRVLLGRHHGCVNLRRSAP